jgi:uncharacterized protein
MMVTTRQDQPARVPGTDASSSRGSLHQAWIWKILLGVFAIVGAYALLIEPYWIDVTYSDMHGSVAAPLKIAHLSDLHTLGLGRRERRMLETLDQEKPDIILITGDSIGQWLGTLGLNGDYEKAKLLFQRLHPPLGVWVVRGNWENAKPLRNEPAFYQQAGVHFLLNSNGAARPDVWIAGLDDPSSGSPRLDSALAGIPSGAYTILLFHSPAYFGRVSGRVNLCLAGHTHGGQVRLPRMRPLWLPEGSGRYVEGWYEEKGSKMYVSRGLGMSMLPIRFLCRPEISFVTIHP